MAFPTTRWSMVLELNDAEQFAQLCLHYRAPLLTYLQRTRRISPADAEDLVQEFFAQLTAQRGLQPSGPHHGLFRNYFLGAFKHHLSNSKRRTLAKKRGGGMRFEPIEEAEVPSGEADSPELAYDRAWALATMMQAMARLEQSYVHSGRGALFFALRPLLEADELGRKRAAENLAVSEATLRVAIHRLRRALRREIRTVVASTVSNIHEIESEVRYLTTVLHRSSWSLDEANAK